MNSSGQTICLNMIVKNEAPVICRCLASVRPIIDHWVIVDTGSTDGTQEIIREFLKGTPGELHERSWENFAHNRSEALRLARGKGDYLFVIDADEVLEIEPGFQIPELSSDGYNLSILYGGCSYLRKQLVRNALPWRYEGVLHEYITCELARTEQFLPGLQTVPHHDGARARDANTYRRDALVLEKALIDDPNNARYVFYLAQSYRDAGDPEMALRYYKRRIEMGGWREEVWFSMYQIGQLREILHQPWPEVMESYLAAWQYQPDRAGPLYRIGMHYQGQAEYHTAFLFFSRAMELPRPGPGRLFVEQTVYDFQLPLEYAVSCFYAGRHAEAITVNNELLRSGRLPPQTVEQGIRNRRFSVDAICPRREGLPTNPTMVIPFPDSVGNPSTDDLLESIARQEGVAYKTVLAGRDILPQCHHDDIVVLLSEGWRLSDPGALQRIRKMFEDASCLLAYGQWRTAEGSLGRAEPAPSETAFLDQAAAFFQGAPIAVRARLFERCAQGSSTRELLNAAGFAHTRFCDDVWAAPCEPVLVAGPRAPVPGITLPLISCLMVTYDRLVLAKRAIRSFAAQTYPNRELVIVTDGSPAFREALERYVAAAAVPTVRFVYPAVEPRATLGRLRNLSLEAAMGEIVCQWDDDDCSHPERLMLQAGEMIRSSGGACFLTDHLQFIEDQFVICWVDWTIDGTSSGTAALAPGTGMMFRDARHRYPEEGPYARQGEDSVFLESLHRATKVVHLKNAGHLYLYQYHGRNTFSREHHYRLSNCRTTVAHLRENEARIREAVKHYPIAKPCIVIGRDGPAFGIG